MTSDDIAMHLRYEPETGLMYWKARHNAKRAGKVAGTDKGTGYLMVRIQGKAFLVHRLAWLLSYGQWPQGVIDHINGIKSDNRLANLRDISPQWNSQNTHRARPCGTTGYLGVSWDGAKGKFQAGIVVDGRRKLLGRYNSPEEAHQAYLAAKRKMHPGSTI